MTKEKLFRTNFISRKAERNNIAITSDKQTRDAMYSSVDQAIDADFNIYLAQHYFRYVLIYILPLFLVIT